MKVIWSGRKWFLVIAIGMGIFGISSVGPAWAQTADGGSKGSSDGAATASADSPKNAGRTANTDADSKDARSATPPDPSDVYRIGVEDELQISVWREPELSNQVVVRPDGVITLPLLNEIPVIGLTTTELQALLTERLKTIVNDPQVTVIVRQIRSRKVYLFGQVVHQGAFTLNSRKTVLELLADAGGMGQYAKAGKMYILRKENGKEVRLPFNYKRAVSGQAENVVLRPGDVVVVP